MAYSKIPTTNINRAKAKGAWNEPTSINFLYDLKIIPISYLHEIYKALSFRCSDMYFSLSSPSYPEMSSQVQTATSSVGVTLGVVYIGSMIATM